jgi:RimJ/RimL family protein N-acetyltransferase
MLRDVELHDVDAYVRMRCDPAMMAELGGPLPREGIEDKVRSDVEHARSGKGWIKMIVPDGDAAAGGGVAGSVVLWSHEEDGELISETGWMVLPEFQGRGLAKRAVRALLDLAREDGRWGVVHAFPGATNGPSNGICRALGFTLLGERDTTFADRVLRTNHWILDLDAPAPATSES